MDRLARIGDDAVQEELESIELSIGRIESALRTLTSVSQDASVDTLSRKPLQILELLQESNEAWMKGDAAKEIKIKLSSSIKTDTISLPEVMFLQSYLDILDNAAEVSPKDAFVNIHLSEDEKILYYRYSGFRSRL